MSKGLIYSPSFDGHRQVHVFVYAHIMHSLGFKVFIAGDLQEKIINSFYIDKLKDDKSITFIDTNDFKNGNLNISFNEFSEIQKKYEVDLTIFAEADSEISLLTSQITCRKRLRGKNIGLFFRPFHFYNRTTLLGKIKYIKGLPSRWKSDRSLFHEFLLKKFKLIQTAFYLDENFVSRHKLTKLLPDVFQDYANKILKDEHPDQRAWIDRIQNFKEQNKGKFIFLYFGTAQKRRGYDILLRMAVDHNACFVHCGLFHPKEKYETDIISFKEILKNRGSLLETNEYISDPMTIDSFFTSVDHLILPYRNFPGSSGVMLQAWGYGIPVLVAQEGIMGYLTKKYNLGLTFNGNFNSLQTEFKKFKDIPKETFQTAIANYMKGQTPEELKRILVGAMNQETLVC